LLQVIRAGVSVWLETCLYVCFSNETEVREVQSGETQPPTIEVTLADNIKCNTPPTERRSLMDKVLEKTESAKQRSKQWVQWLTPGAEEEEEEEEEQDTATAAEGDNNNSKEPATGLPR
jgi:hypothetical protein